ncbi:MAG TPA: DUF4382 domain-containing protein [Mucilaginibacter sp.]|nr:DUF4382 domain-containing protein [Mucilaginibacter sp.]
MKKIILFSLAVIGLGLASCKKNNSSSAMNARVSIKLSDAPGAYDAVMLNVKQVVVITSGGQQTLNVGGGPIDILHFMLGKDTLLAATDIPAGRLEQIRLILDNTGNEVVVGGNSYNLTTPSGQESGVKLNVQDTLKAGIDYTFVLDFDAAQSIVLTGNGKYILKPVIRAVSQAVSGSITGMVNPADSNPKVYAIEGTDTVGTVTDATGKFYFPGLSAGTYQVNFVPDSPYMSKTVNSVVVTNGQVTDMGTVSITQ